MSKPFQSRRARFVAGKETSTSQGNQQPFSDALSSASAVVEQHARNSFAKSAHGASGKSKPRSTRAPHLSDVERELAELRKIVAALAIRSMAHEEKTTTLDDSMTVLDAETAFNLLDNPPEPTDELRDLLSVR